MNTTEALIARLTLALKSRERWLVAIESAAFFAVVLTAFLGNTILCLAFYKTRTLRTPQNYYLVSLAVTDILSAINCSITLAVLMTGRWPFGNFTCQFQGAVMSICASFSLLTLGIIAINRYTKICRSSSLYQKLFSKRNILITIAMSWISTALLVCCAFFFPRPIYAFHHGKHWCFFQLDLEENTGLYIYITFCYSIIVFFTFLSIIFSYFKVLRKIRAHFVQIGNSSLHDDNSIALAEEVKITAMLFATILAVFICWAPSIIIDFYEASVGYHTLPREVYMLQIFTFVGSSAINPLIYGLMNREFKLAYKKVLGCSG